MSTLAVSLHSTRAGVAVGCASHHVSFSAPLAAPTLAQRVSDAFNVCSPRRMVIVDTGHRCDASGAAANRLEALASRHGITVEHLSLQDVRARWLGIPGGADPDMFDEAEAREIRITDLAEIEAIAALDAHFETDTRRAA